MTYLDRLAAIRMRNARRSTDIQRGMTPAGDGIVGRLIPQAELTPIFRFDPWTDRNDIEFHLHAPDDITFLLALVDRALARYAREQEAETKQQKARDHARDCAILCGKPAFQRWLHEVHGLDHPWDSHRAATKVRSLLAIDSRTDLNTDPAAAARWLVLRADFQGWMKS